MGIPNWTPPVPLHLVDGTKGFETEAIQRAFIEHLVHIRGNFPRLATDKDYYLALAHLVRDRMLHRWISSAAAYTAARSRTVAYLSAEFLMGPQLGHNLINLGVYESVKQAIDELSLNFERLLEQEDEPGLGNGGLGRLAACFLDSLATLEIPALGYGLRYEFGIFDQHIHDGWQLEKTDEWLRFGNPWEVSRPEWTVQVKLGGHTEHYTDGSGRPRANWLPDDIVNGVPYDTPILGYRNDTANTMRLWQAQATTSFEFEAFNRGDYHGAVSKRVTSENLTKVLYPNDEQVQGKELRLQQQYFLVSCSLQDMLRIMRVQQIPLKRFHEKFAVQLNDTHPALAVAELMRLLIDEHDLDWNGAWSITRKTFAYTNHTLLPEALERWQLGLFARLLPRHLEIIYEINVRFLDEVRTRFGHDPNRVARLSLIDESGERYVRMAHLACVGSHAINGVAVLHSELLKEDVLKDFHDLWPEKFSNKTNGITPRRWLALSNPRLAHLITAAIGDGWVRELEQLKELERFAQDSVFQAKWREVKRANKNRLADYLRQRTGVAADPDSIFDVQVKRIHEYKRQHLNVLHVISLYLRLKSNPNADFAPRTFIFGGKAAPGYHMAKLIIKLINSVARVVNSDPAVRHHLKVIFLPNYNVSSGQRVYPAADLSEQISTAGKEASGTGNMKMALNGALTIGTLDGANIEIRDEVGADNFFLFGLTAENVASVLEKGYWPMDYYRNNDELREVLDVIGSGLFSRGDSGLFRPLLDGLLYADPYLVLADFGPYADCQKQANQAYADLQRWTQMSILNAARSGTFSSDRTIKEYCEEIWNVAPLTTRLVTAEAMKADFLQ